MAEINDKDFFRVIRDVLNGPVGHSVIIVNRGDSSQVLRVNWDVVPLVLDAITQPKENSDASSD